MLRVTSRPPWLEYPTDLRRNISFFQACNFWVLSLLSKFCFQTDLFLFFSIMSLSFSYSASIRNQSIHSAIASNVYFPFFGNYKDNFTKYFATIYYDCFSTFPKVCLCCLSNPNDRTYYRFVLFCFVLWYHHIISFFIVKFCYIKI